MKMEFKDSRRAYMAPVAETVDVETCTVITTSELVPNNPDSWNQGEENWMN